MRNQFELEAEADPLKLIAITHYGTTPTNGQGETGFRVYLRNSSPREIQTIAFYVQAYGKNGHPIGKNKANSLKLLRFNQRLKSGAGAHPMWASAWTQNDWNQDPSSSSTIACAMIDSAEIAYTDGTMAIVTKQAMDSMTYNPKCLSLDGVQFEFGRQ
ncbi:hypothetical protein [Photobacterium satsumensis]|uniref:hypothetical protein n=1 Tax=Photobacterium satsumensis TaxID=2910239 RepID=UPI003D149AF3